MHTHTHTHPFNGPLSGTTWVSQYQKGKTNLDFTEARDSETSILTQLLLADGLCRVARGPFSGSTRVSWYQKRNTNLDFCEARTVSGSGISWAVCKSAPRSRQIPRQHPTTQSFTGRMPFLPPNQQRQSTEGTVSMSMGQRPTDIDKNICQCQRLQLKCKHYIT